MELSRKLRDERRRKNISQESLAEELEVSSKTIQSWEAGKTVPSLKQSLKIVELFDMKLDNFVKPNKISRNEIEEYNRLGMDVSEVVNYETLDNFITHYGAAEKESEILIPRAEVESFLNKLKLLKDKNDVDANLRITKLSREFVYKWYKFNRANMLFTEKNSKRALLIAMGKIFTEKFNEESLNGLLYPNDPVNYLKDELIKQIYQIEGS